MQARPDRPAVALLALGVTIEVFLRAIFRAAYPGAQVASFHGDPGSPPPGAFRTELAHKARLSPDANNYFCISSFRTAPDGRTRRRKDLFQTCYVIVLDDVGEKLSAVEALAKLGPPSYRLQTSPGSEQWGYILTTPATDPGRVTALLDGLVKADLNHTGTDPGMKGVTRLVRLPVGRNMKAKHGPSGVACVMQEWAPERTFTLDGLASAFGIDLDQPAPAARRVLPKPAGARDLVRDLMGLLDLVQGTTGDGHVAITCPFVDEHTGGATTGTAYLSGGGFKCHHGPCQDRTTPDFVTKLDEMARDAGHGAYRAREDFPNADKPVLEALWHCLARGGRPTRAECDALALVPKEDVERVLRPAPDFFGTDLRPVRRALARARARRDRDIVRRFIAPLRQDAGPVPLPADYQEPVSLDEARAAKDAALAQIKARITAGTGAATAIPRRHRPGRGW